MCTKKQYNFAICGHNEWCESQCQTKMKRVLMDPNNEGYPSQPCSLVEDFESKDDPVMLLGECSACRRPYWRAPEVVEDSEAEEEGDAAGAGAAGKGAGAKGSAGVKGAGAKDGKAAAGAVDACGEKIIQSIERPERPARFKTLEEAFLAFGNIDSSARATKAAEAAAAAAEEEEREYVPYPWNIHRTPSDSPEQVILSREWTRMG